MKSLLLVAACSFLVQPMADAKAAPIDLGAAAGFAVLAGSAVTNTGPSVVNGNLGVWPGQSITGFSPGVVVNGTVYDGDAVAMQAQQGANAAYVAAADAANATSLTGQDLGGLTLLPGVYSYSSSAQLTGTLTLNAAGMQNAVFIFQIGSTLTTASSAVVDLINATSSDQVIWQIGSSATLGTDTLFSGDILALTSITLDTGAAISCGAAIALNGAVTLDSNSVSTGGDACRVAQAIPAPGMAPLLFAGLVGLASRRRERRCQAWGRPEPKA